MKRKRINLTLIGILGVLLLHLCELAVRFPCNHIDAMTFNYRAFVFALALFEIGHSIYRRKICILFWLIFGLSFAIPVVEDKRNILIHYMTWVERGMPEWGSPVPQDRQGEVGNDVR